MESYVLELKIEKKSIACVVIVNLNFYPDGGASGNASRPEIWIHYEIPKI